MRILFLAIMTCLSVLAFPQQTDIVSTTYVYTTSVKDETIEELEDKAYDNARIKAIADKYGTTITQSSVALISNGNCDYSTLNINEIKGEWIETLERKIIEEKRDLSSDLYSVTIFVKGVVRPIISDKIQLEINVLCNGLGDKHIRNEFKSGDDLYLSFKSPVDGYLTIYLHVPSEKKYYCLLPYSNSEEKAYHVKGNKIYYFFSIPNSLPEERNIVDEYVMTCKGLQERNDLIVIFSPNPFFKANSNQIVDYFPRELSWNDFQKWQGKLRSKDKDMVVKTQILIIKKK